MDSDQPLILHQRMSKSYLLWREIPTIAFTFKCIYYELPAGSVVFSWPQCTNVAEQINKFYARVSSLWWCRTSSLHRRQVSGPHIRPESHNPIFMYSLFLHSYDVRFSVVLEMWPVKFAAMFRWAFFCRLHSCLSAKLDFYPSADFQTSQTASDTTNCTSHCHNTWNTHLYPPSGFHFCFTDLFTCWYTNVNPPQAAAELWVFRWSLR